MRGRKSLCHTHIFCCFLFFLAATEATCLDRCPTLLGRTRCASRTAIAHLKLQRIALRALCAASRIPSLLREWVKYAGSTKQVAHKRSVFFFFGLVSFFPLRHAAIPHCRTTAYLDAATRGSFLQHHPPCRTPWISSAMRRAALTSSCSCSGGMRKAAFLPRRWCSRWNI